jgi:nicotinate dehydrogenase subunit A
VGGAVELRVNGVAHRCDDAGRNLLDVLRNDCGLTATRFGCGEGACGACHVIVEGHVIAACNTPVWAVAGKAVTTLEGLGSPEKPHPLQEAFVAEQAMQCGYCVSGILMSAAHLLMTNPDAADSDIRAALDRHLCRCGAHNRILRAIRLAADRMKAAGHG